MSAPPLAYAPFRSSPLANMSTRATILRISETGEMEMEDAVSDDTEGFVMTQLDTEEPMDTDDMQGFQPNGLSQIATEGLFRAGTPTPVVTPPFPQIVLPQTMSNDDTGTTSHGPNATLILEMPGMGPIVPVTITPDDIIMDLVVEDVIAVPDETPGHPHEISTEELDTECLFLWDMGTNNSSGCSTTEFLEFLVTISVSQTIPAGTLHDDERRQ